MVRFWESSAVVPLVVHEPTSGPVAKLYSSDSAQIVWCLTEIEVWSAVCRKRREAVLSSPHLREARRRLSRLTGDWTELEDLGSVRSRAGGSSKPTPSGRPTPSSWRRPSWR